MRAPSLRWVAKGARDMNRQEAIATAGSFTFNLQDDPQKAQWVLEPWGWATLGAATAEHRPLLRQGAGRNAPVSLSSCFITLESPISQTHWKPAGRGQGGESQGRGGQHMGTSHPIHLFGSSSTLIIQIIHIH